MRRTLSERSVSALPLLSPFRLYLDKEGVGNATVSCYTSNLSRKVIYTIIFFIRPPSSAPPHTIIRLLATSYCFTSIYWYIYHTLR